HIDRHIGKAFGVLLVHLYGVGVGNQQGQQGQGDEGGDDGSHGYSGLGRLFVVSFDVVFLDLLVQVGALDPENLGRLRDVPAIRTKGRLDVGSLGGLTE